MYYWHDLPGLYDIKIEDAIFSSPPEPYWELSVDSGTAIGYFAFPSNDGSEDVVSTRLIENVDDSVAQNINVYSFTLPSAIIDKAVAIPSQYAGIGT